MPEKKSKPAAPATKKSVSVWETVKDDPAVRRDIDDFNRFLEKRGVKPGK